MLENARISHRIDSNRSPEHGAGVDLGLKVWAALGKLGAPVRGAGVHLRVTRVRDLW